MEISRNYINECATHLINAYDARSIIEKHIDELCNSTNRYVSHYCQLKIQNKIQSFETYVKAISRSVLAPSQIRKEKVEDDFQDLFRSHGFSIIDTYQLRQEDYFQKLRRTVQTSYGYILHNSGKDKPSVLVDHDINTLTYIKHKYEQESHIFVFLTWEKNILEYGHEIANACFVLTPFEAIDLFQIREDLSQHDLYYVVQKYASSGKNMQLATEFYDYLIDHVQNVTQEGLQRIESENLYHEYQIRKGREKPYGDEKEGQIDFESFMKEKGIINSGENIEN